MSENEQTLPLAVRLWFAWICFFRVIFDGRFAHRAFMVREAKALPAAPEAVRPEATVRQNPTPESPSPALQVLSLFQREGRFIDFIEQDLATFSDGEIGAVARVVHEGCRRALHGHAKLVPIRSEEEGTTVTLPEGFGPAEIKLSGDVRGTAPYRGVLRHRGWRITEVALPTPVQGHDASILCPAEVEL